MVQQHIYKFVIHTCNHHSVAGTMCGSRKKFHTLPPPLIDGHWKFSEVKRSQQPNF